MTDTTSCNTAGSAARSPIEADRDHAMQLGISFNGAQFTFRDFKYDRLRDALAYAELDRLQAGQHAAASLQEDWLERPLPGIEDQALMKQHGISLEGCRYRYKEYLYDRLADALSYAGRQGAAA